MKILIFGASGMVGQGVLRECLMAGDVEQVLCVGRTSLGMTPHAKLAEIVAPDLFDLRAFEARLSGFDACFFCLGVSSSGISEAQYRRLTLELTVSVATTLSRFNPQMSFVYVSGAGTDSTERGRSSWARIKGATENALLRLPFKAAYLFRPGVILPLDGIKSKTASYRIFYDILGPLLRALQRFMPGVATTRTMGLAMLGLVRQGAPSRILDGRAINTVAAAQA